MENQSQQKYTLSFTGSGSEFFKIWIVNILLSIVTLGIYSAWAKVRTQRYFYGNTLLNDSSFDYHATPKQILIGRIIALVLFIVYLAASETSPIAAGVVLFLLLALSPWIIYRSIRFNARVTSHRNVRFNFGGSAFPFYKYLVLYPMVPAITLALIAFGLHFLGVDPQVVTGVTILVVLSFYVAFPWMQRNMTEYVINYYHYGQGKFSTFPSLSTKKYYVRYFVALLLFLLVFFVVGSVAYGLGLFDAFFIVAASPGDVEGVDPETRSQLIFAVFLVYGSLFFVGFVVKAYIKAGLRGHVFAHTKLDTVIALESTVTTSKLFSMLLTNFLLMALTLGFAYPWTKVRLARFFAEHTHVYSEGDLSHYLSEQQKKQSALGEEMGDVFEVGMDFGL